VESTDNEGNPCPPANDLVTFELDGPAEIAGIGNGNPLSMEAFQTSQHSLFHGKAILVLRSIEGKPGAVTITASADGYDTAKVQIIVESVKIG
jgi:beta-galactosidase